MVRKGHGKKNGSQAGRKSGGLGRNQTAKCRHPTIKKSRKWGRKKNTIVVSVLKRFYFAILFWIKDYVQCVNWKKKEW